MNFRRNTSNFFAQVSYTLSMVISLAVGSFFVVNGQILVGGLISLFLASDRLTSPIISIVNITNQLNSVSPLLKNKALQKPISKQFNNLSFVNLPDQQRIVFDNCTLGYENLAILKNINFKIFEGDKILITGKSGIGKSTLFKSLLNELPLIKGKILVDNQLNKSNFLSNFGIVGQDTYIFAESLRFNLTLGKNIPSSQLIKVLKKVKLEYLANKKHLDTPIGEKGLSLSGGEKRKVEIARALLNKKEFLLVDEGLSGLDDDSRKQVFSLLQSLPQTIIEIEHTMSIEDKQKFNQVVNLVAK
ncbi:ATP-binding cassette domain-containing protein [Lactobacillus gasseri]